MRVLIADDDRGTIAILQAALQRWQLDVEVARDGNAAWELLCKDPAPSLAIIDWMMPGLDGLQLCRRIRQVPALAGTHVILLTARSSHSDVIAGLGAGADDYIVKPFELEELRARVQVGVRIVSLQERLAGQVAELQIARDSLTRIANTDALTEVSSRWRWFERATNELERCQRYGRPLSVLMADLDLFKQVNDRFGHAVGDQVLKSFAEALRVQCRRSDVVGRIGGEEFAVLLPETPLHVAQDVARRIVDTCRALTVQTATGGPVTFTCSVGVADTRPSDDAVDAVLGRADAALYEAKRQGRDRVEVAASTVELAEPRLTPTSAVLPVSAH